MTDNFNNFDDDNNNTGTEQNGAEQNNSDQNNTDSENTSFKPTENSNEQNSFQQDNPPPSQQNTANQQPPYLYNWNGSNQKQPKKNKGLKVFAATVTICLILTLSLIAWSVHMGYFPGLENDTSSDISSVSGTDNEQKSTVSVPEVIKTNDKTAEYTSDFTKLYDKIKNSCVSVITDSALGSGFIVTEDGYIITNHHVIERAKNVKVLFYDDTEYEAQVIGSDAVSDIAVLKIEGEFTPIEIGNSDDVKIGEEVVAVGTPYSIKLAGTMSRGIISGIARDIEITDVFGSVVKTMTLIQTDTSINPGNSGGPLINMAGQAIGINTLKLMNEYEGLGFAIPIKNAITIANTLIEHGKVDERPDNDFVTATPRLNITVMNIKDAQKHYEINPDIELPEGAFVCQVTMNSSIYMAGLELYDIITEFNGKAITTKEELTKELSKYKAGDTVSIKVFRINFKKGSGDYHEFSFKLDSAS